MSAVIRTFRPLDSGPFRSEVSDLRRAILPFVEAGGRDSAAAAKALAAVDAETVSPSLVDFVMVSTMDFPAIMDFLMLRATRPSVAGRLWAQCLANLDWDTGRIKLSRGELAQKLGVAPRVVSTIMSELVEFGAVTTRRDPDPGIRGPGRVSYFLSVRGGTHLKREARNKAYAAAPPLNVVEGRFPPNERRSRAARVRAPVL